MALVTIRPKYPRMLPATGLRGLEDALRATDSTLEVEIDDREVDHRVGVTFHEVVAIVGPWVGGAVAKAAIGAIVDWARRRFSEKRHRRPKTVTLYGPNDRPIAEVTLTDADSAAKIQTFDGR